MADHIHEPDDGFHEIQLSGKQLVFLFMATTVISVVIFLCGVLVGRQVSAEGIGAAAGLVASAEEPAPAADALVPEQIDPPATPPEGDLRYRARLEGASSPETLKPRVEDSEPVTELPNPVPETTPEATAPPDPPPPAAEPAATKPEPETPRSADGPQPGVWAVQVISLSDRAGAARIVQRLQSKGYPAFLVAPASGGPAKLYKVQVGRYGDRSAAQKVEARLKKEEQFDTWIVR